MDGGDGSHRLGEAAVKGGDTRSRLDAVGGNGDAEVGELFGGNCQALQLDVSIEGFSGLVKDLVSCIGEFVLLVRVDDFLAQPLV